LVFEFQELGLESLVVDVEVRDGVLGRCGVGLDLGDLCFEGGDLVFVHELSE
jgi:hypothetical protein